MAKQMAKKANKSSVKKPTPFKSSTKKVTPQNTRRSS